MLCYTELFKLREILGLNACGGMGATPAGTKVGRFEAVETLAHEGDARVAA